MESEQLLMQICRRQRQRNYYIMFRAMRMEDLAVLNPEKLMSTAKKKRGGNCFLYRAFILRYFDGWHTENKKLACLEKAIRERNYGSYLAYCKLH